MTVVHVHTACLHGSRVVPVTIEVDIQRGLPIFSIIGLPDKQIEEAKERVRAAIKNSGFTFPLGKITVNLAPSSVRKQGTAFDLGIALGILAASGSIPSPSPDIWVFGELSLSGEVIGCKHLLTLLVESQRLQVRGCIMPASQLESARLVEGCSLYPTGSLKALVDTFRKKLVFKKYSQRPSSRKAPPAFLLDTVVGHPLIKRALAVSVAGRHSILLTGPAGSGKTRLATAAQELLPPLEADELLIVAQLYSFANEVYPLENPLPPFRAPLPTVSRAALLGGGQPLVPGEVSLAHTGILFLDEFPEVQRPVRDALRLPLQERRVSHVRDGVRYDFPANCTVIAAQNPCPCGLYGVSGEKCRCTPGEIQRYRSALTEPILDRFDLFCEVPRLDSIVWQSSPVSAEVQGKRLAEQVYTARTLPPPEFSKQALTLVLKAVDVFKLSGRGRESVKEVASTIARMEGVREVVPEHVQEALQYRQRPAIV